MAQNKQSYDYSQCDLEIVLKKKKTLGYSKRYVYFKKDELVICKEAYQLIPRKVVKLEPFWHIYWIQDKKLVNQGFEKRTIGFKIFNEQDQKQVELYGDKLGFTELREYFSKILFEINLLDDYDVVDKIGKGKYAKVYKIVDKITQKEYAAKYMESQKIMSIEYGRESLLNELTMLRMLDHPNCIKLIRTYKEEKGFFIVTELLNHKKTLQDELQKFKNPSFGYPLIKSILEQLLKGIQYTHSLGIMHRDLKPQNIMFADTNSTTLNNLKIIDFGLGQFISDKKYMYVHVGTPGYVAPEILANESENHTYSEVCDIFSIGVIFHILLTGKSVFQGSRFDQVLKLNKNANINLSGRRYEEMHHDTYDLLKSMLEQNPKFRITAKEALQHPYFAQDKIMGRTNSFSNWDCQNSVEAIKPKKNSLQFFGRYQVNQNILTIDQQQKILQKLRKPESMNQNSMQSQKKMLYKITLQLISIIYNSQQSDMDLDNPFSSTSSPLRFNLQKSRLNSIESIHGLSQASPYKKELIDSQGPTQFTSQTPQRKSIEKSPIKKYSISSAKPPLEVLVEEEDKNEYRESCLSSEMKKDKQNQENQQQNGKQQQYQQLYKKSSFGKQQSQQYQQQISDISNQPELALTPKRDSADMQEPEKFTFKNTQTQPIKKASHYFQSEEIDDNLDREVIKKQTTQEEQQKQSQILDRKSTGASSTVQNKITNYSNQNSSNNQGESPDYLKSVAEQKNQIDKSVYPKDLIPLLDYFPQNIINLFMKKNPDNKQGIRYLALFILFGDRYKKNDCTTQIQRKLSNFKKNEIYDPWFIEILQEMLEDKIDLLNMQIKLEKGIYM